MPSPIDTNTNPSQLQDADVSYTPSSPRQGSSKYVVPKSVGVDNGIGSRLMRSASPASVSISRPRQPVLPALPKSPTSPTFTSLPPFPPSSSSSSKHTREQSKSFFSNLKASKSSTKIQSAETTIRKVPQDSASFEEVARVPTRTKSTPDLKVTNVSEAVPELPSLDSSQPIRETQSTNLSAQQDTYSQGSESFVPNSTHRIPRRPVGGQASTIDTMKPNSLAHSSAGPSSPLSENQDARKNGKLFHNFMKRNHSSRGDDMSSTSKPSTPVSSKAPEAVSTNPPSRDHSTGRNAVHAETDDVNGFQKHGSKSQLKDQKSQSFRDGAGATLFSGIKNTTARAAEGLGKAHNRFFRQNKQQSTFNNRTTEYSQFYELKVINLPLIEQTRITRIAKRLEDSKDKTEFWMPALPWRCIDFLNFTGCETEGLYRVPGSDREVRMWKQRFDQDHDVDLFNEEELYDVNTIGSLFKAWLRELPEEVFPQSIQEQLSTRHGAEEKAPQELRDLLSSLPPWNYYLLFAITCHLSLLHAHQEKNKMTYHNLYVCFAPALKMNSDCFRWLVSDWRSCWDGCRTEKAALEEEYRAVDGNFSHTDQPTAIAGDSERSLSSAGSMEANQTRSDVSSVYPHQQASIQNKSILRGAKDSKTIRAGHAPSQYSLSHAPTPRAEDDIVRGGNPSDASDVPSHNRSASQLPELSFPQPISPIFSSHN